jgi:H/ACA ribonucleoprotein complex subunit 3
MKHILKCLECGKYSISEKCECGGKCVLPIPPKYSPDDKYADYRRRAKEESLKEKGLLE